MSNSNDKISLEQALSVLGYSDLNPMPILKRMFDRLDNQNHETLYPNIRFLVLCQKIYARYRNPDARYVIMLLCSKFVTDIYHKKDYAERKEFFFLFTIIFHFRNHNSINAISNPKNDVYIIKRVKEQMIESGYKQNQTSFNQNHIEQRVCDYT